MKIVTVLRSLKSGGAERHALQLMKGLRARGHEALYAGPMKGWLGQQLRAEGFGGIDLPLSGLYDLPSVVRLALYARRVGADLIHGHLTRGAWYAGLAARLAGLPNVATAHSDNAGKHFGRADRIIAVSQAVADFLVREGYDAARIRMVHHGIPDLAARLPAGTREASRRSLGLNADEPAVLMAARIVPAKGHDTALRALARLTDQPWTLLVAGDQRAVREHHVNFVCAVSNRRAGFCQRNLDIIVAMREVSDGCNAHVRGALLFQRLTGNRDKARVDTDGCGVAHRRFRLMAQGDDFFIGVVIVQGGQVHQFQRAQAACS